MALQIQMSFSKYFDYLVYTNSYLLFLIEFDYRFQYFLAKEFKQVSIQFLFLID